MAWCLVKAQGQLDLYQLQVSGQLAALRLVLSA